VQKCIAQMKQDLAFANYAKRTQEDYLKKAKSVLKHADRPVEQIGREDLRAYVQVLREQGRSASWLKMKLAGIVFLFARTLGRPREVSFIKFPKQHSPLPTVLSVDEVERLLQVLRRPVYRAIAMVLYGTGVRIDEALSLEVKDIDGARRAARPPRQGRSSSGREAVAGAVPMASRVLGSRATPAASSVRVATHGPAADAGCGAGSARVRGGGGWDHQARPAARASAQLRDAPARCRHGRARHPIVARP
jgi:integrase